VREADAHTVRHKALLVAYGVHESGYREVIALDVGEAETEAFWRSFLRSLVERGLSGVELVVSEGPVMVEVPNVRGVGVDEATERLEEAGFEVRTQRSDVYVGLEFVVSSDPAQGTKAPEGSVVTLSLV